MLEPRRLTLLRVKGLKSFLEIFVQINTNSWSFSFSRNDDKYHVFFGQPKWNGTEIKGSLRNT